MAEALVAPPGAIRVGGDHGFVKLQDWAASDLDVVNAARVSFAKQSSWEEEPMHEGSAYTKLKLSEADTGLIGYLMRGRHGTPFEQNFFRWHIRAPIFVYREWHRHRIGISINEESARYTPLMGDFWIPEGEAWRRQVGKPGHYTYEVVDDLELIAEAAEIMQDSYDQSYTAYRTLMDMGFAKEIARAVLPVGIYSQMIWTCNARSLMAFLSLRNDPKAQLEIRQFAAAMESEWSQIMPVTHAAFVENGRVAP